jgi:hypothetical protein
MSHETYTKGKQERAHAASGNEGANLHGTGQMRQRTR